MSKSDHMKRRRPTPQIVDYIRKLERWCAKRPRTGSILDISDHMQRKPKVVYVDQHSPETLTIFPHLSVANGERPFRSRFVK